MIIEIQEHPNSISFFEQIVLTSKGVQESASRAELLGSATGQPPRPWTNGTRLDTHHTVRPGDERTYEWLAKPHPWPDSLN